MFELDGKAIRKLLLEKKMTLRALAQKAAITETTAARLSRDGARANGRTVGKLCDALDIDSTLIVMEAE